ncbi:MAG: apolipoprotein N-acyltransferase [Planctomycetota bacterium]|jgi:apolipoprotein N-acyltransferase
MKHILLAFLSGLLLVLCFPGFDFEPLAWFALVPLLSAIKDKGLKTAFGLCIITGMIFYMAVFHWFKLIEDVSWADFMLPVIYLSTYFGLFGLGLNYVSKRFRFPLVVTAPVLWVSLEYIRSHAGFLCFPWVLIGHSQYHDLPVIQISAFTGVYGVSFLVVMVNAAISDVIYNRSKALKPSIATIIILGISFAYGLSAITKGPGGDTVSISVVQGNVPQDIKWEKKFQKQHLEKHIRLTKKASNNGNTSLIVWPETAVQGSLKHDPYLLDTISRLTRETGIHLLFGSSQSPKFRSERLVNKMFNSAFMVSPEGKIEGRYNKLRLVPFMECLPYKDSFPWPSRYVSRANNYIPGTEYVIFNLDEAKFGVTICWENAFPEHFRRFVKKGSNFMVNITNEAIFGETDAPYQQEAISVFRAVENRVSLVRSANTGISCFIDPHGKIMERVHDHNNKDIFVEGYLTKEIPLSLEKTFYTNYGDVFAYMNLTMTTTMLALCFLKGKNTQPIMQKDTKNEA